MGTISLLLFLSLYSYNKINPTCKIVSGNSSIHNCAGILGAYVASFILEIFGLCGFIFPFLLIYIIWLLFSKKQRFAHRTTLLIISSSSLASISLTIFNDYMPQCGEGFLVRKYQNKLYCI